MKKTYFAPELIQEIFETADVITVSVTLLGGYNTNDDTHQIKIADYDDYKGNGKELWSD